jgi:hypothetical protein
MAHTTRIGSGLATCGLLLLALTGCSAASNSGTSTATVTSSPPAAGSSAADATGSPGSENNVDCSGTSCSVTLNSDGRVDVLGKTITLGSIENGRATLSVGDDSVSCAQGEDVSAGPLTVTCTTVSTDSVTLTASLG